MLGGSQFPPVQAPSDTFLGSNPQRTPIKIESFYLNRRIKLETSHRVPSGSQFIQLALTCPQPQGFVCSAHRLNRTRYATHSFDRSVLLWTGARLVQRIQMRFADMNIKN